MGNMSATNITLDNLQAYTQRNVSYEIQKAIAISIMATAITKWNCNIVEATSRAADCCGFNVEVIIKAVGNCILHNCLHVSYNDMTDEHITDMLSSNRGHHDNHTTTLLHDEDFRMAARTYVRKHACRKGEPNLTSHMFAEWIHSEYGVQVHDSTAFRWLIDLGFSQVHHQKGVYFDGHDREDVVLYRNHFLKTMEELDKKSITCYSSTPELAPGEKPLIRVVHDECSYYANSDQSHFWGDDHTTVLQHKSLGASIMVSDFIDEVRGYVRDNQDQARLLLETISSSRLCELLTSLKEFTLKILGIL